MTDIEKTKYSMPAPVTVEDAEKWLTDRASEQERTRLGDRLAYMYANQSPAISAEYAAHVTAELREENERMRLALERIKSAPDDWGDSFPVSNAEIEMEAIARKALK